MLFSVLIANFNNSRFLSACLDSVLHQTHQNWEVILVDDGSLDNFEQAIKPYTGHNRIRIVKNRVNRGCGYTKAKCASLANGSIAGFLDPDDTLEPEALSRMVDMHLRHPEASLVHSRHYVCDENLEKVRVSEYTRPLPEGVPYLLLGDGRVHHFASFKTICYRNTPGLSMVYQKAVDQDLYYLMEEQGSVIFIEDVLYRYRIHSNSISTTGKSASAKLWHYKVIKDACNRRIDRLNQLSSRSAIREKKILQIHYHKTALLESFKRGYIPSLCWNSICYAFGGGLTHILSYIRKLPRGGLTQLQKTFYFDHEIKV